MEERTQGQARDSASAGHFLPALSVLGPDFAKHPAALSGAEPKERSFEDGVRSPGSGAGGQMATARQTPPIAKGASG